DDPSDARRHEARGQDVDPTVAGLDVADQAIRVANGTPSRVDEAGPKDSGDGLSPGIFDAADDVAAGRLRGEAWDVDKNQLAGDFDRRVVCRRAWGSQIRGRHPTDRAVGIPDVLPRASSNLPIRPDDE